MILWLTPEHFQQTRDYVCRYSQLHKLRLKYQKSNAPKTNLICENIQRYQCLNTCGEITPGIMHDTRFTRIIMESNGSENIKTAVIILVLSMGTILK